MYKGFKYFKEKRKKRLKGDWGLELKEMGEKKGIVREHGNWDKRKWLGRGG